MFAQSLRLEGIHVPPGSGDVEAPMGAKAPNKGAQRFKAERGRAVRQTDAFFAPSPALPQVGGTSWTLFRRRPAASGPQDNPEEGADGEGELCHVEAPHWSCVVVPVVRCGVKLASRGRCKGVGGELIPLSSSMGGCSGHDFLPPWPPSDLATRTARARVHL